MASGSPSEPVMDLNMLLRFRTSPVIPDVLPAELPLCQAQACAEAIEIPVEAEETAKEQKKNKGASKAKSRAKGAKDGEWRREQGGASAEGTPQHPWRKPDHSGRSSPVTSSPVLEAQDKDGTGPPPWRKSPQGSPEATELSGLPSPALSDRAPGEDESGDGDAGGADGGFEMLLLGVDDGGAGKSKALASATQGQQQQDTPFVGDEMPAGGAYNKSPNWQQAEWKQAEWKQPEWKSSSEWKGAPNEKWITGSKEEGGPPLPSELTVAGSPPPGQHVLAGMWFDTLGNMIQVPMYGEKVCFQSQSGQSMHDLTWDKWGRLWCGNGVLHQVGYCGGPLAQDMPPSHLSWRTTAWKFSVWERVATPQVPGPPPYPGEGKGSKKRSGKGSGKGGSRSKGDGDSRGKGDKGERREAVAPKPELPKLGDFLSFPALGDKEKKGSKQKT